MKLPRTILVATDFSDCAERALDHAVVLAGALGAQIHLLNVIGLPTLGLPDLGAAVNATMIESNVRSNHAHLDQLATRRSSANIETVLRTGNPRDMIVATANDLGADLIVMGTHGRRGIRRAVLGSIAEEVVRTAPCPVLTIRDHMPA